MRLPLNIGLAGLHYVAAFVLAVAAGLSGGVYGTSTTPPAVRVEGSDSAVAPHNIHVTYATLGIDGNFVAARVKYFKHDLEKAVALFAKLDSVSLGVGGQSDSLYLAYLDSTFVLDQSGRQLHGRMVGSGEEGEMWWYQLLYEAPAEVHTITVKNRQLTEIFRDQKNILKAEQLTTGERKAYYYNRSVTEYEVSL